MENVKYTTEKSRPYLFREISGGLKATITLLLVLFTSIATFGQTTEIRYYNGKYTKETALKKVNDYLKLSQDNRLKFVGGASSTYQIDGIWEQKINEKDKITVGIRYLIGDKSLSIEIISAVVAKDGNFIVLSPESTNEANRKAYDNQVNLFTKVPFDYLMINENTTNPIANTTTTTGSNTTVKDYSKDNITASYKENISLYVRKINDATVYFYQNNQRINQPLHYEIIEDSKNLQLFTTYTKDYYSSFSLNDMLPEKLYPLTHRNGVFYLYINQNNGNFSFNYRGKVLTASQYELYKSKGDYTVAKIKSDNTVYLFKSDLTKGVVSNSQSKGILVHFADKNSIFVESSTPTQPTKWKIEKENDKYYLVNGTDNRKYSVSDYEKSMNWGIYTIH